MTVYDLKMSGRQFRREFDNAIKGNIIRALTELITNSDDSYSRLPDDGANSNQGIRILFDRPSRTIQVVDNAEGIDDQDMVKKFVEYGGATSGLAEGKSVRGYFGKGIKDVLFAMENGRVKSIKDGYFYSASFAWSKQKPKVKINRRQRVTKEMRSSLGIPKNGTIVEFQIPETESLPVHETLRKGLSSYYLLRMININENREVTLQTRNSRGIDSDIIKYNFPQGRDVLEQEFDLEWQEGKKVDVEISLIISDSPLTQDGDDREGGLLVIDEKDAVLDLTLFGLENRDEASAIYGTLRIAGFRDLLEAEENVLSDTRDGLNDHHQLYKRLSVEAKNRLKPILDEVAEQIKHDQSQLSSKNQKRLDESISQLNDLLEKLTSQTWEVGTGIGENDNFSGIRFKPENLKIIQDNEYRIRLDINSADIPSGNLIQLNSDSSNLGYSPKTIQVGQNGNNKRAFQYVTVKGKLPNTTYVLTATSGKYSARSYLTTVVGEYPEPPNGFAFSQEKMSIPNNEIRYAELYVSRKICDIGDEVSFEVDNNAIQAKKPSVQLSESDFLGNVARISIPLIGLGIGQTGIFTAKTLRASATQALEVVSKKTKRRGRSSGLFTGYRFDDSVSRISASYDAETGEIVVYLKNPLVEKYFGGLSKDQALSRAHCQVFLAGLVLDEVARVAREKVIETGREMYLSDNKLQEDQAWISNFVYEFGPMIHSWIVDDDLLSAGGRAVK